MSKSKWSDENYFLAYEYSKGGFKDTKIAKLLSVPLSTFRDWKSRKPLLKKALRMGRDSKFGANSDFSFQDFVLGKLSPENQKLYKKIVKLDNTKSGLAKIEALLTGQGLRARQSLFVHSWLSGNFNLSKALRRVGINRGTFERWCRDPQFRDMVNEIDDIKGDFFEEHLIKLVKKGSESATVFANKTYNQKRGYQQKSAVDVTHSGTVEHTHKVVPMESLDLPIRTRRRILEAIRSSDN